MGGERELAQATLELLLEARLIDADAADVRGLPRVVSEGTVGSVGADRDGEIRLALSKRDEWDNAPWFTMLLDEEKARAFGACLLRKVRVTVEVIEGSNE